MNQLFLEGFFVLDFVVGLLLASSLFAFGPGPRLSHCFKNSISSSESSNIALTPMYRFGWYPCLFSLCRVASDDIPPSPLVFSNRLAISSIVYSIYSIISVREALNQEKNVKKSDIRSKLLYNCIAKKRKICKFFEFFLSEP